MGVLQRHFALQHFKGLHRTPIGEGGQGAPVFVCLTDFEKALDGVDGNVVGGKGDSWEMH